MGPSIAAIVLGAAWVVLSSKLIPASEDEKPLAGVTDAAAPTASCTDARLIARMSEIGEASGVAVSRRSDDLLWTHNDSGSPVLYALGRDGKVRGRVRVTGAEVDDWEDLTAASCPQGPCLYIADIGDNGGRRPHVTIYRVSEPAPGESATQPAEAFHATYPDRAQDAEALFIGPDGAVFIVTKGEESPVSIYRFPALRAGTTVRLERVGTLAPSAERMRRVTDGDTTWDGRWVALRTLHAVELYRTSDVVQGRAGAPLLVDLRALREPQGEGLAFARDGTLFLAGEGSGGGTLARLSCKLPDN